MIARVLNGFLSLLMVVGTTISSPVHAGQQDLTSGLGLATGEGQAQIQAVQPRRVGAAPFARTELFFGTSRANGMSPVSDEEFRQFLDQEITPRFPDGLTLVGALGQFLNSSGVIVQERSLQLILLYPVEAQNAASRKIERIRTAYKKQFQQESVLRVDDPSFVWASF
jgi:Protein of unknown function (DUF3574)